LGPPFYRDYLRTIRITWARNFFFFLRTTAATKPYPQYQSAQSGNTPLGPRFDQKKSGFDVYAVATKLITQTGETDSSFRRPAGPPAELVTGVFGYDSKRKLTFFGNADVLPLSNLPWVSNTSRAQNSATSRNASYWTPTPHGS